MSKIKFKVKKENALAKDAQILNKAIYSVIETFFRTRPSPQDQDDALDVMLGNLDTFVGLMAGREPDDTGKLTFYATRIQGCTEILEAYREHAYRKFGRMHKDELQKKPIAADGIL